MKWREYVARLWWTGLLSVFFMAGVFYLILGRKLQTTVKNNTVTQELTIARASASNIQSFFQMIGKSIVVLSQAHNLGLFDAQTEQTMDAFMSQWQDSGLIGGVILTDNTGTVKFNANILGTHDVGGSIADRDYFMWAKAQRDGGQYFVSKPITSRLGGSQGQTIVTVSSPVFAGDTFVGDLAASIKLQPLTERFLSLMRVNSETQIYLLDAVGNTLYSNNNLPLSNDVKNMVTIEKEGRFMFGSQVVAYSPINLGTQRWLILVISPTQQLFSNTISFQIRRALVLILMIIITFTFGIIASRETGKKYQNKL